MGIAQSLNCPKKNLNDHHRKTHGDIKYPDCDEMFHTPSSLHRHNYRHKELKFKCTTCGDSFPFQFQLTDHQISHTTKQPHKCAQSGCSKTFKNASSFRKHRLLHDGHKHFCKEKNCNYWSYNERNLSTHKIGHGDKNRYGCKKCGEGFMYHTPMVCHIKGNKCGNY